jgi:2-keto-4-pentenoate hydratase
LRPVDTLDELLQLTNQLLPCVEVVDARHEPQSASAVDDIMGNAAAAAFVTAPGRARTSVDTADLSVSYRDTDGAEWTRSSPGAVSRALRSFVPLANRVVKERRDLGIGGLLLSCPASPTLPIDAEHLVRADFGPLGKLHLHARAAH